MALALEIDSSSAMLNGLATFVGTGVSVATITIYQTQIALAVFELAATPFDSAWGPSLTVSGAPIPSTGVSVAGSANRFVLATADGETALSGTLSAIGGGGDIETPTLSISAGENQTLNSLTIVADRDGTLSLVGSFVFQ